jgi:hypothetical protein
MRLAGYYAVAVGVLMIAQWLFFLSVGQVPELTTAPIELGFHLAAELATAVALLAGGLGLIQSRAWGRLAAVFAFGMLSYTTVVSAGYFAQRGEWPLVAMFAVLLVAALASFRALSRPETGRAADVSTAVRPSRVRGSGSG